MAIPPVNTFPLGLNATGLSDGLEDFTAAMREVHGAESELTIASGSVTATLGRHTLDTESDAATDTLTNIATSSLLLVDSDPELVIRLEDAARIVTISHEAGGDGQVSLRDAAALAFPNSTAAYLRLRLDSGASPKTWREIARWGAWGIDTVEASTAGSGSPNVLTEGESGKVFTNEGATAKAYHTLPPARAGLRYTFVVQDTDGIRVVTDSAADTIRIGASESAGASMYVEATAIGSVITLACINGVEWYAVARELTWTLST